MAERKMSLNLNWYHQTYSGDGVMNRSHGSILCADYILCSVCAKREKKQLSSILICILFTGQRGRRPICRHVNQMTIFGNSLLCCFWGVGIELETWDWNFCTKNGTVVGATIFNELTCELKTPHFSSQNNGNNQRRIIRLNKIIKTMK